MANTYIGTIKGTDNIVYPIGSTLFGTCNTAADIQNKVVQISNNKWTDNILPSFSSEIQKGLTIHVFMTYGNTKSAPTLEVNGSTAIPIANVGNTPATSWTNQSIVTFTYDGSKWQINTPYKDLWYALFELVHTETERSVIVPGTNFVSSKIVDKGVVTSALGYTPPTIETTLISQNNQNYYYKMAFK